MSLQTTSEPSDIRYLKGIGPKRALALQKIGVNCLKDLLYFFPRRYEDRSRFRKISELTIGEHATFRGQILSVVFKPIRRMPIVDVTVGDDSGMIHAIWFNRPYLKGQFQEGQEVILFGKMELYQNRLQMNSPEYEFLEPEEESIHTGRITPIYPLTEGLFQRSLRSTLKDLVDTYLHNVIKDPLPSSFLKEKNLIGLEEAIAEMHFPTSFEKLAKARERIVFDEFLIFELILLKRLEKMKSKYTAPTLEIPSTWNQEFISKLPFQLTGSQQKAIDAISQDLKQSIPMNRLLHGDVGSGKTLVAAYALFLSAQNKKQGVMLVPTEILAEQHYQTLKKFAEPFHLDVALLTSSVPEPKKAKILAELKQGKISMVVGTHALLQSQVQFKSLALVVTDEQHKFGVYQRSQLLNTNPRPHQLVMSATPIPRTLALTLYADLDLTTLTEMPAGRKPIKTYWITRAKQREIFAHVLEKIKKNNEQAYIVFPIIEETEKSDLLAAKKEYERLRKEVFINIPVGLVHGKLSADEREPAMKAFRRGEIKILVATSVIEVGLDNPNATMMIIENAERFGLSQLHQLRGRVGRGERPSECFLFGEPKTDDGKMRLRIMTKTQDGFVIAEEDLKLRGPGDFLGNRQSGAPMFRVANPITDMPLLLSARETAQKMIRDLNERPKEMAGWLKILMDQLAMHY